MKNKRIKDRNVPNLRFPGFEGEWELIKFDKIACDFSYGMNSAAKSYDGVNKYIRITDIDESSHLYFPNPLSSPNSVIDEKYRLETNDIVFARTGASVGKSYLYKKEDGNLYYAGFLIKARINKANANFVFYQTLRSNYEKWVKVMSMRSGQPGINAEEYRSLKLNYTIIEEQKKICSFLSVIDLRIQTQNKIIENLESLMKGMMQQIFSQQLRFKDADGSCFPDWEEKMIGNIGSTYNGLTGKSKVDFGKGKPYVQYSQIFKDSEVNSRDFGLVEIGENDKQHKVNYGDILFTTSSETPNEVGISSVLLTSIAELYLNSFCFGFRPNNMVELLPLFAKYLFRSRSVRKMIIPLAQGSTRYNMSKTELLKKHISIPKTKEQQLISTYLSSIDKKIQKEKQVLTNYQQQKSYLLQNLFI